MMDRSEISKFLKENQHKNKEQVLSSFTNICITRGVKLDKIGKLIMDLRSYPEWKWGE